MKTPIESASGTISEPARNAPRSLVITPDELNPELLAHALVQWAGTVDAVLLRLRRWPDRHVYALARRLGELQPRPALLVSERFDIALAAGLEGVHLREHSLPAASVRNAAPDLCIGVSRHDAEGLSRTQGADYALMGPVYPTGSKPGHRGMGIHALHALTQQSPVPILALGGVHRQRVEECLQAGAHGVAVLSAVWQSRNPIEAGLKIGNAIATSVGD